MVFRIVFNGFHGFHVSCNCFALTVDVALAFRKATSNCVQTKVSWRRSWQWMRPRVSQPKARASHSPTRSPQGPVHLGTVDPHCAMTPYRGCDSPSKFQRKAHTKHTRWLTTEISVQPEAASVSGTITRLQTMWLSSRVFSGPSPFIVLRLSAKDSRDAFSDEGTARIFAYGRNLMPPCPKQEQQQQSERNNYKTNENHENHWKPSWKRCIFIWKPWKPYFLIKKYTICILSLKGMVFMVFM